jgi:hypothetical protein
VEICGSGYRSSISSEPGSRYGSGYNPNLKKKTQLKMLFSFFDQKLQFTFLKGTQA